VSGTSDKQATVGWRVLLSRTRPIVYRVDGRTDPLIRLVRRLDYPIPRGQLRPSPDLPALRRVLKSLPLGERALAYMLLSSARNLKRRKKQAPISRSEHAPIPGRPPFRQFVGTGTTQWKVTASLGQGPSQPPAMTALSTELSRKVYCGLILSYAQADVDRILSDDQAIQPAYKHAGGLYQSAVNKWAKGDYAGCLKDISDANAFRKIIEVAAADALDAFKDLERLYISVQSPPRPLPSCEIAPIDALWRLAYEYSYIYGLDPNNPNPDPNLWIVLDGLEAKAKAALSKQTDVQSLTDCITFQPQWYGGDLVLDESCTVKFTKWLHDGINSGLGSALQGLGASLLSLVPYAGGALAVIMAVLAVDAQLFELAIPKEDRGNGVTIHVSQVGWLEWSFAGVTMALSAEAATGAGDFWGEPLATGLWITGN
jgi:hypothetical protein